MRLQDHNTIGLSVSWDWDYGARTIISYQLLHSVLPEYYGSFDPSEPQLNPLQ